MAKNKQNAKLDRPLHWPRDTTAVARQVSYHNLMSNCCLLLIFSWYLTVINCCLDCQAYNLEAFQIC